MLHLVIMHQPYLDYILVGTKTIESRFLSRQVAPYDQVQRGDTLVLKQAGGPLRATAQVEAVQQYAGLTPHTVRTLLAQHAEGLQIDASFAERVVDRTYAVLLWLANVSRIEPPVPLPRRDRRPWVVLQPDDQAEWLQMVIAASRSVAPRSGCAIGTDER